MLTKPASSGPHAFLDDESPTYPTGCKLILACAVGQICVALGLRALLVRRNKKRDEAAAAAAAVAAQDETAYDAADMTDFENPHFRYLM